MSISKFTFKIPIIGDGAVGKTSLVSAHVKKSFNFDHKPTLGADITKMELDFPEKLLHVNLALWDIAGQKLFKGMRRIFLEGGDAVIAVYDVTKKETFESISSDWYKDVKKIMKKYKVGVLVANKIDLADQRAVTTEEGLGLARKMKRFGYLETSAKTMQNIAPVFEYITQNLLEGVKRKK